MLYYISMKTLFICIELGMILLYLKIQYKDWELEHFKDACLKFTEKEILHKYDSQILCSSNMCIGYTID